MHGKTQSGAFAKHTPGRDSMTPAEFSQGKTTRASGICAVLDLGQGFPLPTTLNKRYNS